jgi:DNA-binding ferritin-like protein (Dps family)
MIMSISKFTTKVIGEKRRWRQYKARTQRLPANYRDTVEALERYFMHFGAADGDSAASMFEDLVELFEQGAADGTPIRGIVGDDPVEFADTFLENYAKGGWVTKEQDRLTSAIDRAAAGDASARS